MSAPFISQEAPPSNPVLFLSKFFFVIRFRLARFCAIKACEITKTLREYLKNIEENTLEIYKEEGLINFGLFEVEG
jgi:hypothetical protein